MKQFKKSLSLFLYFITLFFLISCGFPVDGKVYKFNLPEGLYGGDIYSAREWYDDDELDESHYHNFSSLRIGYTYENDTMPIDNIKFKVHYGIFEEWFYSDINLGYLYNIFSEDIDDYIIRLSLSYGGRKKENGYAFQLYDEIILLEKQINIHNKDEINKIKVTNTIIEGGLFVKLCKTEYLESCSFLYELPIELINLAMDEKNSIYEYYNLSFILSLVQEGIVEPTINKSCVAFADVDFQIIGDEVIIIPHKTDYVFVY